MKMRVWNVKVCLSYLVDGYVESGLHFSINFFRGEVTGQKASTQHTVKTAAAVHPLHTLLKINRTTNELKYLSQTQAMQLMLIIAAVNAPSGSGSRSSCSVSCRQAGPPTGSRGCHKVEAKMTTQLWGWRATVAIKHKNICFNLNKIVYA